MSRCALLLISVLCLSLFSFQLRYTSLYCADNEYRVVQRIGYDASKVTPSPIHKVDPATQKPTVRVVPSDKGERDFFSFCKRIAKNNTIMMTYTDEGYLPLFDVFYRTSHLERYSNFFVVAADAPTFHVGSACCVHA